VHKKVTCDIACNVVLDRRLSNFHEMLAPSDPEPLQLVASLHIQLELCPGEKSFTHAEIIDRLL
jgi:hypothetical protein